VSVNLQYAGAGTILFQLRVNGSAVAFGISTVGAGLLEETIYNLSAGDVLDIYLYAYTANAVFSPSATTTWKIDGYEY
jgi:protein involved in polysaccharide export with SLBB domain